MKTICTCGRKATCNCRKVNGRFVFEGEQVAIDLENDVQYVSMCPQCYFRERSAFYAAPPVTLFPDFMPSARRTAFLYLFCIRNISVGA